MHERIYNYVRQNYHIYTSEILVVRTLFKKSVFY